MAGQPGRKKGGGPYMIEAKRKDGESIGAFLRRFTKKVQLSGVLKKSRRLRFRQDVKTKREKQLAAVRRSNVTRERERLYKLGKLED
ncbi:MAG: 30S ribosomal protein S21 [Patescibacteria group bacterium]